MMIETIRNKVKEKQGVECCFRFHGTRNQIDEFQGTIVDLYPAIFTVLSTDRKLKTFSYSDILTQNLEILY